jgi:DNA-directed RNA polymerase sigma subunit (sigma70/sigma32)
MTTRIYDGRYLTYQGDRNHAILGKRRMGATLRALGKEYGISGERIRQICDAAERDERRMSLRDAVIDYARHGWSDETIARYLGVTRERVRKIREELSQEDRK